MCINFVEMEVDVETGEAKLLRELIGTDVGQIIDPKACEMQLQASIGSAMVDTGTFEETIYDYYTGRIMTNNLGSIPSIIFGLFGMALFVNALGFGDSIIAGSFTLGLLALPLVIRTTEEALKAVPDSYRTGSLALGATKLQTIWRVVLPTAFPNLSLIHI